MSAREEFLQEIEAFLAKTGMAPTTFGLKAVNDRAFINRLRGSISNTSAQGPGLDTVRKIRSFMKSNARYRSPRLKKQAD
jgi:hypothetical protein